MLLYKRLLALASGAAGALDGSGRAFQTRIAACELLHALVVWTVGESAREAKRAGRSAFRR